MVPPTYWFHGTATLNGPVGNSSLSLAGQSSPFRFFDILHSIKVEYLHNGYLFITGTDSKDDIDIRISNGILTFPMREPNGYVWRLAI